MAIGSIYQLTHRQLLYGEDILNVYHYLGIAAEATAADLIDAFQEHIIPLVKAVEVTQMTGRDITVISIGDFADFAQETDTPDGILGPADLDAAFLAWNVTLRTNIRNIGPGSKRFSGLPSSYIENGYITEPTGIIAMSNLCLKLVDIIGEGATETYQPIVVKRILVPVGGEVTKAFYRMPETLLEAEFAHIISYLINLKVSHQVSRGNGR